METGATHFLELRNVSKNYGGVVALDRVNFGCDPGTIHAILGENGAGKSTLIKIIAGVVQPTQGEMLLQGQAVKFGHPVDANAAGVVCVFQELSLLPTLSVAENIGITMPTNRLGMYDRKAQHRKAEELLARVGCEDINPRAWVNSLPLSRRQMVEIAKALGKNPRLLILDEATSALTSADVEKVMRILGKLRDDGLVLLYISHRMHEIKELADVLSVFRNGQHVETFPKNRHSDDEIVQLMIGRDLGQVFPPKPPRPVADVAAPAKLEVKNLRWENQLNDISFRLGKGEILGLGGLDGQGQKELLLGLFGVLKDLSGEIKVDGQPTKIGSPHKAKSTAHRIALVPEDRKTEGLMLPMGVGTNITIASLQKLRKGLGLDQEKEASAIAAMVKRIQIKVSNLANPVSSLSGGNQQKVVLAKWLMTEPQILMLNDPTRGIDVGTKQELYQLLRQLADAGTSILFYSTDYDELIGCCDRVLILYQGQIARELVGDEITETNIVASALNINTTAHVKAVAPPGQGPTPP
ncbi:MAG TPA: sugar ABC transporter ATP-binding protein [Polyangia bacterium]|jgi:ribose transport system ATP-binding protein|nr:sugar ABC transporter ATP-binding protein [Polyangia bacterium]